MKRFAIAILLTAAPSIASATTWGSKTIEDPIGGKPCTVAVPASMGSYVYEWPEKYDQVFFPVTDPAGLWACDSGFASLIGDIELTAEERARIQAFVMALPRGQRRVESVAARLDRIEALYALRELTPARRALVHRILAYDYEALADNALKAAEHRRQALPLMLDALTDESLDPGKRLEYLFVCAGYLREQGNLERSNRLLAQLWKALEENTKGPQADYAAYLGALIPNVLRIEPGGRLAPDPVAGSTPGG